MQKFKIKLHESFNETDVFTSVEGCKFKMMSEPEYKYDKWWHKVLYYLTLKQLFVTEMKYNIELFLE